MKIFKAAGRACLKELRMLAAGLGYAPESIHSLADSALNEIGWEGAISGTTTSFDEGALGEEQELLALAMCAAIAGVKPE